MKAFETVDVALQGENRGLKARPLKLKVDAAAMFHKPKKFLRTTIGLLKKENRSLSARIATFRELFLKWEREFLDCEKYAIGLEHQMRARRITILAHRPVRFRLPV